MTHTAEPMTLEKAIASVEVRNEMRGDSGRYPSGEGWGHCYEVEGYWIPKEAWQTIKDELAKQREAEPIGEVHWMGSIPASGMIDVRWKVEPEVGTKLYTHPQQRNVPVEVSDNELPGMRSSTDFTGGDSDERSYAERNAVDVPTLPVSIRGKIYEVPVPVQVRIVLLEMKMKELTTPPKSASVPVERLEALVESWSLSALTHLDDSGDPYNICVDHLAELIAEYK